MTYLDIKTKATVRIVHVRLNGKIQCQCTKTGLFCWRNSIKELMQIEHWMVV